MDAIAIHSDAMVIELPRHRHANRSVGPPPDLNDWAISMTGRSR
jgi:hypothetical protein